MTYRHRHTGAPDGQGDKSGRHDPDDLASRPRRIAGFHGAIDTKNSPLVEAGAGPTMFSVAGGTGQATDVLHPGSLATTSTSAAASSDTRLTVAGPTFDSVGTLNGHYFIPPDNASAAGRSAVVVAVNGELEWFGKSGGSPGGTQSLASFFGAPSGVFPFDPEVAYDATNDRFIVTATTQSSTTSQILIAVSKDGNPADGWTTTTINAEQAVNGLSSSADFPRLAVDGQAIYVTANMFANSTGQFEGSRLWTVSDSGLYSGGSPSSVAEYDPSVLSGAAAAGNGELFTLMPTTITGTNGSPGTYLVSYDGAPSSTAPGKALNIIGVDNPLSASGPRFTYQQVNVGQIDSAAQFASFLAPQGGTANKIAAGDGRILGTAWSNGHLYAVADVMAPSGPDKGHVTAHWFELSPAGKGGLQLTAQGNVSGSLIGNGVYTYDPSIGVDAGGDFVVNVSASGPSLYAGAYYQPYLASNGFAPQTPVSFAAGIAPYVRTFGAGQNRWGDFSSITADPSATAGFWAFNQYALAEGDTISGESGRWGTRLADITLPGNITACFRAGTRIRTQHGDVAVENLRIRDVVLTATGEARPIVWIGQRRVDCQRHPRPELVWPVRIRAGAFAEDRPKRDLFLSPDHSVFCDGVLIPVHHLINGATIVRAKTAKVHYFHIELDRHDVLLAEGLEAESYLDTGNRAQFENGAAHMSLHPDFSPLSWANACAPLCTEGSPIHAARSRLRVRTIELSGLHVEVDGRAIRPAALKGSRLFQFLLPATAREVRIVSRAGAKITGILLDGKVVGPDSLVLADDVARLLLPEPFGPRRGTLLELVVHEVAPSRQSPRDPVEQHRAA